MHGKNRSAFAGHFETVRDRHGPLHDRSIGDNCDIAAGTQLVYLSELPRLWGLAAEIGLARLAKAQIDRTALLSRAPARCRFRFSRIAWRDDAHVRDRRGNGHVFLRVVGSTEGRIGYAASNS